MAITVLMPVNWLMRLITQFDNPGVSAALVKTDGTTAIMLTSDTTGEQSGFSVSVSGNTDLATAESSSEQPITQAQDAIIHLDSGWPCDHQQHQYADDVIPGVTMTFSEVSDPDDPSLM